MIGLDTNILVRMLTNDLPDLAATARRYVEAHCTAEHPGRIDRVVLCEIVWVLRRGYGYGRGDIARAIEVILTTRGFVFEDANAVWAALRAYAAGNADFPDRLIEAANRAAGCEATATFDCDAARLPGFSLVS